MQHLLPILANSGSLQTLFLYLDLYLKALRRGAELRLNCFPNFFIPALSLFLARTRTCFLRIRSEPVTSERMAFGGTPRSPHPNPRARISTDPQAIMISHLSHGGPWRLVAILPPLDTGHQPYSNCTLEASWWYYCKSTYFCKSFKLLTTFALSNEPLFAGLVKRFFRDIFGANFQNSHLL